MIIQFFIKGNSAFNATISVAYGVWIKYPDGTSDELYDACGSFCSNFEHFLMCSLP
jgi:hypothetical protein